MKSKELMAVLMSVIMIIGMSFAFSACGETVEEPDVEEAAAEDALTDEEASQVAETVDAYIALAGEYQDEYSQRASATVIANTESQSVNITVMWSSSAAQSTMWTMNAELDGSQLVYSDCTRTELVYADDADEEGEGDDLAGGGAEETVVYEDGSGYFEVTDDGKLLWTGAQDADCQQCSFVRVTE